MYFTFLIIVGDGDERRRLRPNILRTSSRHFISISSILCFLRHHSFIPPPPPPPLPIYSHLGKLKFIHRARRDWGVLLVICNLSPIHSPFLLLHRGFMETFPVGVLFYLVVVVMMKRERLLSLPFLLIKHTLSPFLPLH